MFGLILDHSDHGLVFAKDKLLEAYSAHFGTFSEAKHDSFSENRVTLLRGLTKTWGCVG